MTRYIGGGVGVLHGGSSLAGLLLVAAARVIEPRLLARPLQALARVSLVAVAVSSVQRWRLLQKHAYICESAESRLRSLQRPFRCNVHRG